MLAESAFVDSILAATDFSEPGNRAVAHAYAVVRPGGTVHLLHVIELMEPRRIPNPLYAHYVPGPAPTAEKRQQELRDAERKLEAMVPADARSKGIVTTVLACEASNITRAILNAARRLAVPLICVGSRRRSPLARLLTASVARTLLRRAPSAVVVVRAPSQSA